MNIETPHPLGCKCSECLLEMVVNLQNEVDRYRNRLQALMLELELERNIKMGPKREKTHYKALLQQPSAGKH